MLIRNDSLRALMAGILAMWLPVCYCQPDLLWGAFAGGSDHSSPAGVVGLASGLSAHHGDAEPAYEHQQSPCHNDQLPCDDGPVCKCPVLIATLGTQPGPGWASHSSPAAVLTPWMVRSPVDSSLRQGTRTVRPRRAVGDCTLLGLRCALII